MAAILLHSFTLWLPTPTMRVTPRLQNKQKGQLEYCSNIKRELRMLWHHKNNLQAATAARVMNASVQSAMSTGLGGACEARGETHCE